jgi:hypothetical protein
LELVEEMGLELPQCFESSCWVSAPSIHVSCHKEPSIVDLIHVIKENKLEELKVNMLIRHPEKLPL